MTSSSGRPPGAVLVDTSAWFAMAVRPDGNFARAQEVLGLLANQGSVLVLTNFLLAEGHALFVNRVGSRPARRFLSRVEQPDVLLVDVRREDEARARAILDRYVDKEFTYTDATSFAVMERLGIRAAFTFDRHFAQYGLATLGLSD